MYFSIDTMMILIVFTIVKATTVIANKDDLNEFIKSLRKSEVEDVCSICLETLCLNHPEFAFEAESDIERFMESRSLLFCSNSHKHMLHVKCLMVWYLRSSDCPVCRKELPNNLFTKYISNLWCNFFILDGDFQKKLISQFKSMRNELCIKVLEIFKFNFEENRIENFKNFFPNNDGDKARLIDVFNRYDSGEEKFIVYVSRNLTDQTYDILEKTFTPERVSRLMPKDLLTVCNMLSRHCKKCNYRDLAFDLNVIEMAEYSQKFTFEELVDLVEYDLEEEGDLKNLSYICCRMCPKDQFDEKKVLEYIATVDFEGDEILDISNLDRSDDFLNSVVYFYKLNKIEFFGRLFSFIINRRNIKIEKCENFDLEYIFFDLFYLCIDKGEDNSSIHTDVFDFMIFSNTDFNQQSKTNLVGLLIIFFKSIFESCYVEENCESESMDIETANPQSDQMMQEMKDNGEKRLIFDDKIDEILKYVINNDIIGEYFLYEVKRSENYNQNKKLKNSVEYFEGKMYEKNYFEMNNAFN